MSEIIWRLLLFIAGLIAGYSIGEIRRFTRAKKILKEAQELLNRSMAIHLKAQEVYEEAIRRTKL